MTSAPRDPKPVHLDPGGLSQVVMRLRDTRRLLGEAMGSGWDSEDSPFLRSQIESEVREIESLLAPLKAKKTKGWMARMKERKAKRSQRSPDFEGNAWTIPIPELVGFLSYGRKTGILWVDSAEECFVIELSEGGLVRATSNQTPETLRLGELLVQFGTLEADEIEQLVSDARQAGMSLGGYLIRSGRAKDTEIEAALMVQVQGLFHRLMSTENAVYRFREGVDLGDAKALDLNVTQLLLEGARLHDEGSLWRDCDCPGLEEEAITSASEEAMGEETTCEEAL